MRFWLLLSGHQPKGFDGIMPVLAAPGVASNPEKKGTLATMLGLCKVAHPKSRSRRVDLQLPPRLSRFHHAPGPSTTSPCSCQGLPWVQLGMFPLKRTVLNRECKRGRGVPESLGRTASIRANIPSLRFSCERIRPYTPTNLQEGWGKFTGERA